jgi:hypothetical protein
MRSTARCKRQCKVRSRATDAHAERAYEGAALWLRLRSAQTQLALLGPGATPHLTHSVYRARAVIGKEAAMRDRQHAPASGSDGE